MTRKYQKTFSNGVSVRLKVTATTGREKGRYAREAASHFAAQFRGKCEPEDAEKVQAEFEQFLRECSADVSRAAGGIIYFQPVPVPVYEIQKGYSADSDTQTQETTSEGAVDNGIPETAAIVASNGEVVAPADSERVAENGGAAAGV